MNTYRFTKAMVLALMAMLLACYSGRAQTFLTNDIINMFDNGGQTADFANSGSVHSWLYWYNSPGGNQAITNDVDMDAGGDPNSGSLMVVSPLAGYTQNQFFGTFNNGGQYDLRTEEANLVNYNSVSFDIRFDSGTPLSGNGDLGSLAVLAVSQTGPPNYNVFTATLTNGMVIPAQAKTNWVHMVVPIDHTLANISAVGGIGFNYNSYGGYPLFTTTNWIDNLVVHSGAPPPPPPTMALPAKTISGLHSIDVIPSANNNRYHLCTVNDNGYSFYGQSSVTYTWNVQAFPANSGFSWQQHIFFVGGAPGPFDQAADYNLANCIFLTIQGDNSGQAYLNFRYKTNEPGGNGMLFNSFDKNNNITYPVAGSPTMPAASLTEPHGAVGNWSITFDNSTNVTLTSPTGLTTNFVFDPAAAALFADPMTICVGGQPGGLTNGGQEVVIGGFSATGVVSPINDTFTADTTLDTNTWKNISNDTNGCVLVPAGQNYKVPWSLPDNGFSLLATPSFSPAAWVGLTPGTILDNGKRVAFLNQSNLVGTNMNFFRLVQRQFYQLQVLLPGETAAPGTPTGKTGTPDMQNTQGFFNITVNAVDKNWYPIAGITDTVSITSTDPQFIPPANASLQNGTIQLQPQFGSDGTWTITATDVTSTSTNILANTSSPVDVEN